MDLNARLTSGLSRLLFVVAIGLCLKVSAAPLPTWKVQPKVCIVERLGDSCELELSIEVSGLTDQQYCFFQDNVKLDCWTLSTQPQSIVLKFHAATAISLRDANNRIVLTTEIELKARHNDQRVRRVRQPWSLF